MKTVLFLFFLLLGVMSAGCVKVPEAHFTISHYDSRTTVNDDCGCDKPVAHESGPLPASQAAGLDPLGFTVVNWNTHKGRKTGWDRDLTQLILPGDVILLQEGHLTPQLRDLLRTHDFNLDLATAFTWNEAETGVLTAARIKPDFLCSFREKEPIGSIPKTVLITRYPLAGTNTSLLVANVHMVNFSIELSAYRRQLEKTEEILARHRGPVILSGDLNTWNDRRMAVVADIAEKLNMKPVGFADDHRSSFMGQRVDHIYYRGLVPVASTTTRVTSSDHNPMQVTFMLAEEH